MRFNLTKFEPSDKYIEIEHKGQSVGFNIASWSAIKNPPLVFEEINAYWDTLPDGTQSKIFVIYQEIADIIDATVEFERMHNKVRDKVMELYQLMPFEQLEYFTHKRARVKLPLDLRDNYGAGAPEGALTYLRHDYMKLIALLTWLRCMIPIWGEYVTRCKKSKVIENIHKEYQAGLLLRRSAVPESPAFVRLEEYILAYLGNVQNTLAMNLGGVTTANFPNWVLYGTVVKKLAILELPTITTPGEATNVMSKVYNHIRSLDENPQKMVPNGILYDKATSSTNDNVDGTGDNTSRIELVRVKEQISEGEKVALEVYTEDTIAFCQSIDCTIDRAKVETCMSFIMNDAEFQPEDYKFVITAWAVCGQRVCQTPQGPIRKRVLSPKALKVLRYESQLSLFAAAQALLWHWGYCDLAMLITDVGTEIPRDVMISGNKNRMRPEYVQKLVDLYPFSQVGKQKSVARVRPWPNPDVEALRKQATTHCVAIKEIDSYVEQISSLQWEKKGPAAIAESCNMQVKSGFIKVSDDICNELAKLVISSKEI